MLVRFEKNFEEWPLWVSRGGKTFFSSSSCFFAPSLNVLSSAEAVFTAKIISSVLIVSVFCGMRVARECWPVLHAAEWRALSWDSRCRQCIAHLFELVVMQQFLNRIYRMFLAFSRNWMLFPWDEKFVLGSMLTRYILPIIFFFVEKFLHAQSKDILLNSTFHVRHFSLQGMSTHGVRILKDWLPINARQRFRLLWTRQKRGEKCREETCAVPAQSG